ncbi:TetR/AcrR family transcriptional regulator [Nocardioides sp.]|uniref:TetR/AcrR family transcriptional regulator n=1 Tax=Nocardioides sp. TaxID=35761 RepID=UPI003562F1A1
MSEPVPARRGRPGHDVDAVLRTAVDLFNQQGYDATSVGDVAAELGVTKSAIYHHVPSKEHLLALALDEALVPLERAVATATAAPGPVAERLRECVRASVHVLVENQPSVTLLLRVHGNSQTERSALERRRQIDAALATLVTEAIAEGTLRDDLAPELVSRLVFGMVNSLVEWHRPDRGHSVDDVAETIAALAFDGLLR